MEEAVWPEAWAVFEEDLLVSRFDIYREPVYPCMGEINTTGIKQGLRRNAMKATIFLPP